MAYLDTIKELEQDLFKLHPDNKKYYDLIEGIRSLIATNNIRYNKIETNNECNNQ